MSVGKPILRVGKLKAEGRTSLAAADGHLSRTRPTHNADPERTGQNAWLTGGPGTLAASVASILRSAGVDPARLRKDATLANDVVLSISPEWFRPGDPDEAGTWDEARRAVFQEEAAAFLREQFGGRLAVAVLHLDEATPHVQAVVVPIVKRADGTHGLSGRDYFGPDRLVALQDAWEARLKPHGVGPRERGSTATHRTIRSFYSALQAAPEVPPVPPPSPPPLRALLPGGSDAMTQWQGEEVAKARKRQKPLAAAAAKGMLYEAEKAAGDTMRRHAAGQAARIAEMRSELAKIRRDLVLTKDQISTLRGVPVAEVAAALGYAGDVGRRENAIDLVKRVGELSFEDATRWMAYAYSPEAAGAAAGAAVARPVATQDVPLTKADKVKAVAIRRQLAALDAPAYRLTVQHVRADGEGYGVNLGRMRPEDEERTWEADEVVGLIPRLTAENARGGQVYVTPLDDRVHHVLLDDLSAADVKQVKEMGYTFSTVLETSPGNHQGVVKVLARDTPREAVNEWFKTMNRELGDERITGLRHPMRLAGFQNRKAKYEQEAGHFPFVRLVEATRAFCARARAVIAGMANEMTKAAEQPIAAARSARRALAPRQ